MSKTKDTEEFDDLEAARSFLLLLVRSGNFDTKLYVFKYSISLFNSNINEDTLNNILDI